MTDRLRILTTHDFFGSFAPTSTSFGSLAGGEGLRATIHALRKDAASLWIDTGDAVQGGPLTPLTKGLGGYAAIAELGIDASVVGNHELDFGVGFLNQNTARLGFPVLGANSGFGLPATTLLQTTAGAIGVIGVTHHNLASMSAWTMASDRLMPAQTPHDNAIDCAALAAELRRLGARAVILAIHDGVDWAFDDSRRFVVDTDRLFSRLRPWAAAVDVILAGHTLGRFFGRIDGTPILQPWPLGCEVGAIELELTTDSVRFNEPFGVMIRSVGPWRGSCADLIDSPDAEILGSLPSPLFSYSNGPSPLATFLAEAVQISSDADIAFAYVTYAQPVIDGIFACLPAGHVSLLQLLQLVPYSDHSIVETEVDISELARIRMLTQPRPQARSTAWAEFKSDHAKWQTLRLATTDGASTAIIEQQAGRTLTWRDIGRNLSQGVRELLSPGRSRQLISCASRAGAARLQESS